MSRPPSTGSGRLWAVATHRSMEVRAGETPAFPGVPRKYPQAPFATQSSPSQRRRASSAASNSAVSHLPISLAMAERGTLTILSIMI